MKLWIFAIFVVPLLAACSDSEPVRLTGGTMGTTWSIAIADPGDQDFEALHLGVMQKLAEVNGAMSTWDPDSEISQFNQMSAGCMTVSPAFAGVVETALDISALSDGAYDISLGPLIDLWGFGAAEEVVAPTDEQIANLLARTGYRHVEVDGQNLCKDIDDIQINLSSIAKGYGVDVVADYLSEQGIENFLVEIGGELYASGEKNDQPWTVGVENPASQGGQSALLALPMENQAVATSGDYRNFFMLDGERYSHIIDARSGRPIHNQVASVSVIADSVTLADGWATALMAVGSEHAFQIADELGFAVLIIMRDGDEFEALANPVWVSQFGNPS